MIRVPAQQGSTPALSRTWTATITDRCYGEVWGHRTHTVTISNFDGYTAEIDGQPASVIDAGRILSVAKAQNGLTLIREVIPTPAGMLADVARQAVSA